MTGLLDVSKNTTTELGHCCIGDGLRIYELPYGRCIKQVCVMPNGWIFQRFYNPDTKNWSEWIHAELLEVKGG